ncbi:unnamed protein product, partial [Prorocentrum cordatum]
DAQREAGDRDGPGRGDAERDRLLAGLRKRPRLLQAHDERLERVLPRARGRQQGHAEPAPRRPHREGLRRVGHPRAGLRLHVASCAAAHTRHSA